MQAAAGGAQPFSSQLPPGLLRPSMAPQTTGDQRQMSRGNEIRSSYDAPNVQASRTSGGAALHNGQNFEGTSNFRRLLEVASVDPGLEVNTAQVVPPQPGEDAQPAEADTTPNNPLIDFGKRVFGNARNAVDAANGDDGVSTTQSNLGAGNPGWVYQDNADPFGENDQVDYARDADGNALDPVTGRRLDDPPQLHEDQMIDYDQLSADDRAWADYLKENGYNVVADPDQEGTWMIRGDSNSGGRGESTSWHGAWGNPEDWTDGIQSLRERFDAENKVETDRKAGEERKRKIDEMFGLLPDVPQFDEAEANSLIDAQNKMSTFENARGMRAAQAGAARGRMSVGAQAGMMADASNRLSLQQGEQAEKIRYQMKMVNFNAQLQDFTAKEGILRSFIQGEQDAAAREQAQKQLRELIKYRAEIQVEMEAEQARAQASANRGKNVGGLIGTGLGAAGGAVFGGPGGAMAGAQAGNQGGQMLGSLFDMF